MARTLLAAGTIPWRLNGSTLEVLLVHRPKYDDWSWPKGKLDRGETLPECAVRETEEETGLHVALGQPLTQVRYKLRDGEVKTVHMWAAQELSRESDPSRARCAVKAAATSEIDDHQWLPAKVAMKRLTYKQDREPLGVLMDQHEDEKLATTALVVVRHGRAMKRSAWRKGKGAEDDRPLTPTGVGQAQRLVGVLSAFGVADVLTSPWERCAATVRPYLEVTGIGAELRPELTEEAHRRSPKKAGKVIDRALRTAEVPTAICIHRPTLPTVIDVITEVTPNRLMKQLPERDPWLRTGEMLVLHVARRRRSKISVVAVETVRP